MVFKGLGKSTRASRGLIRRFVSRVLLKSTKLLRGNSLQKNKMGLIMKKIPKKKDERTP